VRGLGARATARLGGYLAAAHRALRPITSQVRGVTPRFRTGSTLLSGRASSSDTDRRSNHVRDWENKPVFLSGIRIDADRSMRRATVSPGDSRNGGVAMFLSLHARTRSRSPLLCRENQAAISRVRGS
jgi:hypothetical protein